LCEVILRKNRPSSGQAVNHRKNPCAWMFKKVVALFTTVSSIRVCRVRVMVSVKDSVKCAWIFPVINGL